MVISPNCINSIQVGMDASKAILVTNGLLTRHVNTGETCQGCSCRCAENVKAATADLQEVYYF